MFTKDIISSIDQFGWIVTLAIFLPYALLKCFVLKKSYKGIRSYYFAKEKIPDPERKKYDGSGFILRLPEILCFLFVAETVGIIIQYLLTSGCVYVHISEISRDYLCETSAVTYLTFRLIAGAVALFGIFYYYFKRPLPLVFSVEKTTRSKAEIAVNILGWLTFTALLIDLSGTWYLLFKEIRATHPGTVGFDTEQRRDVIKRHISMSLHVMGFAPYSPG